MWLANFANDASSMVHLRSSPWHIPYQPYGRLSIVVHYPSVSIRAAQSGLQSAPACRMRWVCHHLFRSYDRNLSNIANIRLHSVSGHTFFSAKLSRIWQIASRDSVTIFLFHETCKRVFFPSDLPYCLVRTLKSRKSFPIPSPKGLNEREKNFRDYGKRFQQPPDYSRIGEGNAGLSALFPG